MIWRLFFGFRLCCFFDSLYLSMCLELMSEWYEVNACRVTPVWHAVSEYDSVVGGHEVSRSVTENPEECATKQLVAQNSPKQPKYYLFLYTIESPECLFDYCHRTYCCSANLNVYRCLRTKSFSAMLFVVSWSAENLTILFCRFLKCRESNNLSVRCMS